MWSATATQLAKRGQMNAVSRSLHAHTIPRYPLMRGATTQLRSAIQQKRFAMSETATFTSRVKESAVSNPVAWWIFGCAGLVGATLTVGAASRLTRSGVSMLYWVPRSVYPPRSEEDWHKEYELYNSFAENHSRRPMSFEEFKRNYKYEKLHRHLGQATSAVFLVPLGYFFVKNKVPPMIQTHLAGVLALGATQMYFGNSAVQRRLKQAQYEGHTLGNVSAYGMTTYNAFSMANMALLLWAGFHLVSPPSRAVKLRELTMSNTLREIGVVRQYFQYVTGVFAAAVATGTIVAGIDAGKEFNTFPKMGKQWIPDGIFEKKPWLRNFHENVALVQLDHRLMAIATIGAYSFVYMKARKPHIWESLPPETKQAFNWTMLAVGGQAAGGITMLVNEVPTTLAMVHQSGAAAILGTSLWTLYTLRFARSSGVVEAAKMASKIL